MKNYIEAIVEEIELQINQGSISLIRIEGIESPLIYKEVCRNIKNEFGHKLRLEAKLSKEKYEQFLAENKPEWKKAIEFLEVNNFIDFDGAMTRWRNNSVDLNTEVNGDKVLVVLMGTEMVQDIGGLADFYFISPETIIRKLNKNYAIWFEELFEDNGFERENLKAIHTVFRVIFKEINIDLIKYSNLIDELYKLDLKDEQELIQEVLGRLDRDWKIPSIIDTKKIPKVKTLLNGTLKSCEIVTKSYKFINREDYKNILSKSKLSAIYKKIAKYAEENSINIEEPFPSENPVFNSYGDFKECLIDFINGKNLESNKEKFLSIDFVLINEILNIKLKKEIIITDKITKLTGNPLEVYEKMILTSINFFCSKHHKYPSDIRIKVKSVKLSNCATDTEKQNAFRDVCSFLGGIVNFIAQESIINEDEEEITIAYNEGFDPFDLSNFETEDFEGINLDKTKNLADLSKFDFTLDVFAEDEKEQYDFIWVCQPQNYWQQAFCILSNYIKEKEDFLITSVPLYAKCNNIHEYTNCESDEEFFIKLQKMRVTYENVKISDEVKSIFPQEFIFKFEDLNFKFGNFMNAIINNGFFNTICLNNNQAIIFIECYTNFMEEICNQFDNFTSMQKDKLYILVNAFIIFKDNTDGIDSPIISQAIVPPYNPVMLEKIIAQMLFIRKGYVEIFNTLKSRSHMDTKEINNGFNKLINLSSITSGLDILLGKEHQYLLTEKVYGYFAIYNNEVNKHMMLSENIFGNEIIDDEEIERKNLLNESPQSKILTRSIMDYIKTFPSRTDGLNVLIVNPLDMQHIVAGVHSAVEDLRVKGIVTNINLRVLVPDTRKNGADYLRYWLDNFFADDNTINVKTFINYTNMEAQKLEENVEEYIKNEDLSFIYNILTKRDVNFEKVNICGNEDDESRFPMTFTPQPISRTQNKRCINMSQFQFKASKAHTQLAHLIRYPDSLKGDYRVLKELEIAESNATILAVVHKHSKWVVCMDEAIDRNILANEDRKIIGFTTGEGCFGELNVTISAREDILEDIEAKLKNRLIEKFSSWKTERVIDAAKFCIEITKELDGSRLLKALNPNDYEIHNFLAYVLTLQSLQLNKDKEKYLVRSLINLDSHKHWFEASSTDSNSSSNNRPDFLLLEIENNEGVLSKEERLKIKATVIECKMGKSNACYIEKATKQLETGIRVLSSHWNPYSSSMSKRYWFNQLYRSLIFSRLNIEDNTEKYSILINKIYQILEGNFELEWNGSIFAFWLDENSSDFAKTHLDIDLSDLDASVKNTDLYTGGQLFIQKMLVPQNERNGQFIYDYIKEEDMSVEFERVVLEDEYINNEEDSIKPFSSNKKEEVALHSDNKTVEEVTQVENVTKTEDVLQVEANGEHLKEGLLPIEKKEETSSVEVKDTDIKVDDVEKQIKNISDVRVLLGQDLRTNEKFYWEFGNKQLNNRHLLISGNSGFGKTYCIQALLLELARQGISSVIFDYTDGFKTSKLDPVFVDALGDKIVQRYVKSKKFPINPFARQNIELGDEYELENDVDIANRMAAVFTSVYKFGPQQNNVVYQAVKNGLSKYPENMNFRVMAAEIEEIKSSNADSVISKIRPFLDIDPFLESNEFSWKDIIDGKGMVYIIQLTGFDRQIQVMLTELILWDIWNYCVMNGDESIPFPIVLDEAQNLNHGLNSPSGKILTEGRKFGIAGCYATQFLKGLLNDDEVQRLQQAGQKLYFCPPEKETSDMAKNIDINTQNAKEWAEKLKKLKKGECVTCGSMVRKDKLNKYEPRIIKIISLEERVNGN